MQKTIFFLSFLLLASCYDVDYIYVIDTDHGVCSKREVTNRRTWASKRVADLPLEECDGHISVTAEDFARMTGRKNVSGK